MERSQFAKDEDQSPLIRYSKWREKNDHYVDECKSLSQGGYASGKPSGEWPGFTKAGGTMKKSNNKDCSARDPEREFGLGVRR